MRPGSSLITTAVVAGLALAACGPSGSTSGAAGGVLAGRSASDIVRLASQQVQSTSMRFDLDGTIGIDTDTLHGIPAGDLGSLRSMTIAAQGEEESPARARMTMSLKPLVERAMTVVAYDGTGYVATDGTHFAQAGSVRSLTGGLAATPGDLKDYLGNLGAVQDQGAATQDGMAVEHLHATLGSDFLRQALAQAGSGGAQSGMDAGQLAQVFSQLITFNGGNVDAFVRQSDGRLNRLTVSFSMAFNLDKLGGLLGAASSNGSGPGGSLGMSIKLGMHMYDYGAHITVARPVVDPSATVPSGVGNGLLG